MTSSEIAVRETPQVDSWTAVMPDVVKLAAYVAETEFVPKTLRNRPAAVAAAILSGREMGIGPMRALAHVHMVDGRPSLSAEQKRAAALAAGHDIVYIETTTQRCIVKGRRKGSDEWSAVTWTMDDAKNAKLAGKDNWRNHPRRMLQARATGELCDMIFPDASAGLATYEELVDDTDAAGITNNGQEAPKRRTARRQTTVQNHANHGDQEPSRSENHANNHANHAGPPLPGEDGYEEMTERAEPKPARSTEHPQALRADASKTSADDTKNAGLITSAQRAKMLALFRGLGIEDRAERLRISTAIVNREIGSANELTKDEASALIDTLETVSATTDPIGELTAILAEIAQQGVQETFDAEIVEDGE